MITEGMVFKLIKSFLVNQIYVEVNAYVNEVCHPVRAA